jgi:hypothetical protein
MFNSECVGRKPIRAVVVNQRRALACEAATLADKTLADKTLADETLADETLADDLGALHFHAAGLQQMDLY